MVILVKTITEILAEGESETVEFKPSLSQMDKILETASAFSNTKGGTIVVGVDDKSRILGVSIGSNTLENLANDIKRNTDPPIFPSLETAEIEGKKVILIQVPENQEKPAFFRDKAYKRVGRTNQRISSSEIRKLAKEEKKKLNWDEQICERASLQDIDEENVRWFLRRAKAERNLDIDPETPVDEALERLKLLKEGGLTNAAMLLFGKNPQKFFLQARIRCARFKGVSALDYIDMKIFEGTIPELRKNAMNFIMQYTKHGVFFDENRRYDKWEYPLRPLEEILSNALAHREYETTAEIQLSVFDGRIEVWNPGELPKPLTPDDLKRKHRSLPRNHLIAEALFLIKYIEQWGKGTIRVIEELRDSKLPEPVFQNLSGGFEVVVKGPGKEFEKEIDKEKFHMLDISDRQKKAILHIKERGKITKFEYCKLNGIGPTYAKRELNDMLKKNIIKRIGTGRSTHYALVSD